MKLDRTMNVQVCTGLLLVSLSWCLNTSAQTYQGNDHAPAAPKSVKRIANAKPQPEPFSQYGNPESYVIAGKRYDVQKNNKDHVERGTASWYGMKFHGKKTSSGEIYDIYGMTAAHKTLPIPTYATVTNLTNGKSVLVKINDRGPFVDNRIIDLSFAAAKKLEIVKNGTAPVEIKTITYDPTTVFKNKHHHFVQLGAFESFENAWKMRQKIKHLGKNLIHINVSKKNNNKLYHVKVGPLISQAEHNRIIQQLTQSGLKMSSSWSTV